MGVATMHPSQRRVSCEGCRKQKARCQRLHKQDPKCSRCILLNLDCTAGKQKKVGRPRRADTPDSEHHAESATATTTENGSPGLLRDFNQQDWDTLLSKVVDFVPGSSSEADCTDVSLSDSPSHQYDPWNVSKNIAETYPARPLDASFGLVNSQPYSMPTPETMPSPARSSGNSPMTMPSTPWTAPAAADGTTIANALTSLSLINIDLHTRVAAVETYRGVMNLNLLIYKEGPLYINYMTLSGALMKSSQDFLTILTQLLGSRPQGHEQLSPETAMSGLVTLMPPQSAPAPATLAAPLALTITSIFTQLIYLYEVHAHHLAARIERIGLEPVAPIPGITIGALPVPDPCTQGMLFAEIMVHLLESIEQTLGLTSRADGGRLGLLSPRQMAVLWNELGGDACESYDAGLMRPAAVRRAFQDVRSKLKKISLASL